MKKGQVLEGIIERVEFPNKGIVYVEGTRVIVKNGIPGQKIRFSVNKVRKGKCEGRILEVLEKSPQEQDSPCPHFTECGGCTYQNLPYDQQLQMKEGQIRALLDSVCEDYLFEGIKASPEQYAYRNKMEFSFGDAYKGGPLALGMHKKGSFYDIVTTDDCQIVDEDYRLLVKATLAFAQETGLPFYHKMSHQGYFRHLLLRKGKKTGEILADLVTSSQSEPDLHKWADILQQLPLTGRLVGILHTTNDSMADVIQNDSTEILYGQDYFYEELLGLEFRISPFSFFQTNSLGAEVLYETARSYIGETKDKIIFDLYSGTGTIAQVLAPVARHVTGVEIVEEAVAAARLNAERNGLTNCDFIAGDVLKVLGTLNEQPDLIVLDPPRDGIHPKALEQIIQYGVKRMVYISCKPTSLVRDLEVLQERGYRVEKACAVDLFPGTFHVETVCLLGNRNAKPDTRVKLSVDTEELQRVKNGEKI